MSDVFSIPKKSSKLYSIFAYKISVIHVSVLNYIKTIVIVRTFAATTTWP